MPNDVSPSDHAPLGLVCTPIAQAASEKPVVEELSAERKALVEAAWNAIPKPIEKAKGRPDPAQMEVLKAFAEAKKQFIAKFSGLEQEYAKKLSKK